MIESKVARDGDFVTGQVCPGCERKIEVGRSVVHFDYRFLGELFGVPVIHTACLAEALEEAPLDQSSTEALESLVALANL